MRVGEPELGAQTNPSSSKGIGGNNEQFGQVNEEDGTG